MEANDSRRHLGLGGATGIGVGAIVGGGILALAGTAFAATGPSAILAFALNGVVALFTAMSFAELATRFHQSGGTYAFAKKVYSVEMAFVVGWVVWFASIVAGVLYALGFGEFGVLVAQELWRAFGGESPAWLTARWMVRVWAVGGALLYAIALTRSNGSSRQWATIGKVVLFLVLIVAGGWVMLRLPAGSVRREMTPFFSNGGLGLMQAMGYTFIALQGFDLIAAVGGEVRDPHRNLPRSMFLSLGIALAIYLPLLLVLTVVGVEPGVTIVEAATANPESIMAVAAERIMGPLGYWLVLVAAVLAMLSALQANLLGASRVALAMARDQTLPRQFARLHARRDTPVNAIAGTTLAVILIVIVIPDVAAAGAAASLIFLITFALAHITSLLARRRGSTRADLFRSPLFPLVPIVGATSCIGLAAFQGVAVPAAGSLAILWAGVGGILYLLLFARRARVIDAGTEAIDPRISQLRGKSPLVLVPIANPTNAPAMIEVANTLAVPGVGRVLLLFVVSPPDESHPELIHPQLLNAQDLLRVSLSTSLQAGLYPEAMTTLSRDPWNEIVRVSRLHRCESLLVGFSKFDPRMQGSELERLVSRVDCDVALLRAPPRWELKKVQKILVPLGGRGSHDVLRARLLGSLCRDGICDIVFLRVLREEATDEECRRGERELSMFVRDELPGRFTVKSVRSNRPAEAIVQEARDYGLIVLGLQRMGRRHKGFGSVTLHIARSTPCPMILISSRG